MDLHRYPAPPATLPPPRPPPVPSWRHAVGHSSCCQCHGPTQQQGAPGPPDDDPMPATQVTNSSGLTPAYTGPGPGVLQGHWPHYPININTSPSTSHNCCPRLTPPHLIHQQHMGRYCRRDDDDLCAHSPHCQCHLVSPTNTTAAAAALIPPPRSQGGCSHFVPPGGSSVTHRKSAAPLSSSCFASTRSLHHHRLHHYTHNYTHQHYHHYQQQSPLADLCSRACRHLLLALFILLLALGGGGRDSSQGPREGIPPALGSSTGPWRRHQGYGVREALNTGAVAIGGLGWGGSSWTELFMGSDDHVEEQLTSGSFLSALSAVDLLTGFRLGGGVMAGPTALARKQYTAGRQSLKHRLPTSSALPVYIGGFFELSEFGLYNGALLAAINRTNERLATNGALYSTSSGGPASSAKQRHRPGTGGASVVSQLIPQPHLVFDNASLCNLDDAKMDIDYICRIVNHSNGGIAAFIAIGSQDMINILSIVTTYLGIPIIGYSTDHRTAGQWDKTGVQSLIDDQEDEKPQGRKTERPLYLQLDPSKSLMARALVRSLQTHNWYYASIIIDENYANDGFLRTFKSMTADVRWRIEDTIILARSARKQTIDYKLYNLLENKSRVIIVHASVALTRRILRVAGENGFTREGYAWFLTEDALTRDDEALQDYPVGLVAYKLDKADRLEQVVHDSVTLVAKATTRFAAAQGSDRSLDVLLSNKACDTKPTAEQYKVANQFYRYLKDTSFIGSTGNFSFDEQGIRAEASFTIYNLIERKKRKRWKEIGRYRNDTFKVSTIVWPGRTLAGPIVVGERTLRVVTNIIAPFVMEQQAMGNKCVTAVPCLRTKTKDKETLDGIFKDFAAKVVNTSRPYNVSCCQGLSIHLLDRLARDLNFSYQLYITTDGRYGNKENASWNGLVEDLIQGAAHMAVAALSITKSRSNVIDFTHPYFFSGFSILVSERKRQTPIYAFLEPFDGWVWISIIISATVMAIAVSLVEWNSPFGLNPWGRKRKTNYTFGSALNMVYAIFFQHTTKTKSPKAWPSKWIQNFWAGASIFIYSSYTANLAAFLAGKNSGVIISGIHDPKLLEPRRQIGTIRGNSVEDFLSEVNNQLLFKAKRYPHNLTIENALGLLMNGTIDAYLDDSPILEYARTTMDAKCQLRLVGKGFGEDGYGIALPKGSFLKLQLSQKILQYHESGFLEDLQDMYFRRSKCNDNVNDGQLQGEAAPMNWEQHAGLYLLLAVGIFVCIGLMFLEHATFRWLVPYWRKKPPKSFWKSYSMMFWSQRLYRIITSEELVSPHHSAREMMEVVRNRDFTKLFQKSVKKQEKLLRNKKTFFTVVEQLQWRQRREERLSQNPSLQTDCSQESDNSATPVNLNADRRHCALDDPITTDTNDDPADDWPENWEKEWIADDDDDDEEEEEDDEEAECIGEEGRHRPRGLYKDGHVNQSFSSHTDMLKLDPNLPTPSSAPPLECCIVERPSGARSGLGGLEALSITDSSGAAGLSCPQFSFSPQDEYVFNFASTKPHNKVSRGGGDPLSLASPSGGGSAVPTTHQSAFSPAKRHQPGHHISFTPPPKLKLGSHAIIGHHPTSRHLSHGGGTTGPSSCTSPSSSSAAPTTGGAWLPPVFDLLGASLDDLPGAMELENDPLHGGDKSLSSNPGMPLLGNANSSSEDNILMSSYLPNGVLILSPNGDVFARDGLTGRNVLVRPKTFANFKNFTTNLPQSMKTLPLKDNRVKSNILSRSRTLDGLNDGAINNDIEPVVPPGQPHHQRQSQHAEPTSSTTAAATSLAQAAEHEASLPLVPGEEGPLGNLEHLTKEQLYFMWKMSEKELNKRLKRALREKAELEQKLATLDPSDDT